MSGKRKRDDEGGETTADYRDAYSGKELMSSAASILSVPISLLFRQVENQGQLNPLLSRSEAQTFLQINILSEELDTLTDLTQKILQDQEPALLALLKSRDHPYLRPLRALLESIDTSQQMHEVSARVKVIVKELSTCCKVLRHSAEQNWSMAHFLSAAIGTEKQILSKIEDELCRRIQLLSSTQRCHQQPNDTINNPMVSMEEYCQNLIHGTTEKEDSAPNEPSTPSLASASKTVGHSKAAGTSFSMPCDTPEAIATDQQNLPETQQKQPAVTTLSLASLKNAGPQALGATDTDREYLLSNEYQANIRLKQEASSLKTPGSEAVKVLPQHAEETTTASLHPQQVNEDRLSTESLANKRTNNHLADSSMKPAVSFPKTLHAVDTAAQPLVESEDRLLTGPSFATKPEEVANKLAASTQHKEPGTTTNTKEPITQPFTAQGDSDDDELLEDMVQQESAKKMLQVDQETVSQELTSPAVSPKQDVVEKENEPSQSSSQSSIHDDTAFRSQNAVEVLFSIRESHKQL